MPASPPTDALLQQAREQERQRISALLHDEVGGQLLGLKLALAGIARQLDKAVAPDTGWLRERIQALEVLAAKCLETSARISTDLSLPPLQAGLPAALETLCQQFGWQSGIRCDYLGPRGETGMNGPNEQQSQALYLICREALNNVGKHAQASHVKIQLAVDETGVNLKISDNGNGIVPASDSSMAPAGSSGQGLANMAARAREIGASLQQTVAPGQPGCCWEVHFKPLMT